MNRPIHFDLVDVERQARAQFSAMLAAGRSRVTTDRNRKLIDVQEELYEATLTFLLCHVRARNEGVDPEILMEAAGSTIGQIVSSMAANVPYERDEALSFILDNAIETIEGCRGEGEDNDGAIRSRSSISGTPGGHA